MLRGRSYLGVNRTQVDVPAPLAHIVGVTDGVTELRPFAANFTYSCHNSVEFLPGLLPNTDFTEIPEVLPPSGPLPTHTPPCHPDRSEANAERSGGTSRLNN